MAGFSGDVAALLVWLMAVGSGGAQPQATVGEVLDRGGVQLSREELSKLLPGAMLSGPTETGDQSSGEIAGDGGISGTVRTASGRSGGYSGKWLVNAAGQFCHDVKISVGRHNSTDSGCTYFFRLGKRYFVAETVERTAHVLARTIVKN